MTQSAHVAWSRGKRIRFRFLAIFWSLTFLVGMPGRTTLLDYFGRAGVWLGEWLRLPMRWLAQSVGSRLFHLQGDAARFVPTGSGDTALDWLLLLLTLLIAPLGGALWGVLDSERTEYQMLGAWLRLLLSFVLGATLLGYGFFKVFPSQFQFPSATVLDESYGESSPMRLLWTFMGASRGYQIFAGVAECAPGLLLFFRRTRTLGALMSAAVMLNVTALNYFYDVPVKLYSTLLFLLSLWLAGPDLRTLWRMFFLRGTAQLSTDSVPATERVWLRRTARVGQLVMLLTVVGSAAQSAWSSQGGGTEQFPLAGSWKIVVPQGGGDANTWDALTLVDAQHANIRRTDGTRIFFDAVAVDMDEQTLALTGGKDEVRLSYTTQTSRVLNAAGERGGVPVTMRLERVGPGPYLLLTRGFHWVSRYPYNR